jgi:NADP-dependent alcohol dehydrogenase
MNNFEYYNPVKIFFGKGEISKLSQAIEKDKKVLMIYGGGSIKKNGVYNQVQKALSGYDLHEFSGIEPNPEFDTCLKAVEYIKNNNIDFILAVGGGSVIDATKFISAATNFAGDPWDILAKGVEVSNAIEYGTVLTIPATGSEMNCGSVISRRSINKKLAFMSEQVFPKFSVLDPEVT